MAAAIRFRLAIMSLPVRGNEGRRCFWVPIGGGRRGVTEYRGGFYLQHCVALAFAHWATLGYVVVLHVRSLHHVERRTYLVRSAFEGLASEWTRPLPTVGPHETYVLRHA